MLHMNLIMAQLAFAGHPLKDVLQLSLDTVTPTGDLAIIEILNKALGEDIPDTDSR